MTPELKNFLQSWEDWRLSGAPNHEPYIRSWGLCSNALDHDPSVLRDLRRIFSRNCMPFGNNYTDRVIAKTQHLCPKRIAWVQKMLASEVVLS